MTREPGHRRRGLPRTERNTPAQPEGPVDVTASPQSPRPATGEPEPGRRRGLPKNDAEAAAQLTGPAVQSADASDPAPSGGREDSPSPTTEAQKSRRPLSSPELEKPTTRRGADAARWVLRGGTAALSAAVLALVLVLCARWFLGTETGLEFLQRYPGQYQQPDVITGYPWWLNWAHFFNAFLMVLIIKTGIQIRIETRPAAYWSPRWNKNHKISLTMWTHQVLDLLWVLNGAVFVVLLFSTGYWVRVVPTSWEVVPNAVSAALQYASLTWPTHGGWAHYNSLQELAYFTTIFIAAPLAIATGIRMSGLWPAHPKRLNTVFPAGLARAVHFPVMVYFAVFIILHVILVFATGALHNLNQIYAGQDAVNWTGFWLFTTSLLVIIAGVAATRAVIVAPAASLFGKVGR